MRVHINIRELFSRSLRPSYVEREEKPYLAGLARGRKKKGKKGRDLRDGDFFLYGVLIFFFFYFHLSSFVCVFAPVSGDENKHQRVCSRVCVRASVCGVHRACVYHLCGRLLLGVCDIARLRDQTVRWLVFFTRPLYNFLFVLSLVTFQASLLVSSYFSLFALFLCHAAYFPGPGELTTPAKRSAPDLASSTKNRKGLFRITIMGGAGMDLVTITAAVAAAASVPSSFTSAAA